MKRIYWASVEPDYNADINGTMFKAGEISEAAYSEGWDGDVEAYVANAMEGEYDLREGIPGNVAWNALSGASDYHTMYVDGVPAEIWFAQ